MCRTSHSHYSFVQAEYGVCEVSEAEGTEGTRKGFHGEVFQARGQRGGGNGRHPQGLSSGAWTLFDMLASEAEGTEGTRKGPHIHSQPPLPLQQTREGELLHHREGVTLPWLPVRWDFDECSGGCVGGRWCWG